MAFKYTYDPVLRKRPIAFDFPTSQAEAKYWVGLANLSNIIYKYRLAYHNLQATTAPSATDDAADNYAPGSLWVDKTNDKAYICVSATVGAAVWRQIDDVDGGSP